MTTLEMAQKYGVPTHETCKELNWQRETNFFWEKSVKAHGVWRIRYKEFHRGEHCMDIKAPQMHEITPLLPETIYDHYIWKSAKSKWILDKPKKMHNEDTLDTYHLWQNNRLIGYYHEEEGETCNLRQKVENNYAEAYAQLYIQLKKENLL